MLDRVDFMNKRRLKIGGRFPELKREFDLEFMDALVYLADYPENTAESLRVIQNQVKIYLREKGNTRPPKYLWKGLLRVSLTPVKTLLGRCAQNQESVDQSDYFA